MLINPKFGQIDTKITKYEDYKTSLNLYNN